MLLFFLDENGKKQPVKSINQISLTISHSNLIQNSRKSFLSHSKPNPRLSTQNSHPVSLYEKGQNLNSKFQEPQNKNLTCFNKPPKNRLNIEGMKAKLIRIRPLLPTKNLNIEENSESTTITTALLSREEGGKDRTYLKEFNNSKGLNSFLMVISF